MMNGNAQMPKGESEDKEQRSKQSNEQRDRKQRENPTNDQQMYETSHTSLSSVLRVSCTHTQTHTHKWGN